LFLSLRLERPLFLEGEAGVGKTSVATTLAEVTGGELIRLQCYEGLDASTALYEWDYPRQLLHLRLIQSTDYTDDTDSRTGEHTGQSVQSVNSGLYGREFLVGRPLLRALEAKEPPAPVLLIDEIDRADEEFEALLLELLSDFSVTIPELGTIRASVRPQVIITSNRTREVHDALKRRCLYHWIDYPSAERELAILHARRPDVGDALAREVVSFVQRLRTADLVKPPGVAEMLDWAAALVELGGAPLEAETIDRTMGALLKYQDDVAKLRGGATRILLDEARTALPR
jgi:MoxR-like ATPase